MYGSDNCSDCPRGDGQDRSSRGKKRPNTRGPLPQPLPKISVHQLLLSLTKQGLSWAVALATQPPEYLLVTPAHVFEYSSHCPVWLARTTRIKVLAPISHVSEHYPSMISVILWFVCY